MSGDVHSVFIDSTISCFRTNPVVEFENSCNSNRNETVDNAVECGFVVTYLRLLHEFV